MMIEDRINVGSNTAYNYTQRSPGDYEFRIYRTGASSYVKRSFYSYGSWGGNNDSFEVNNEGNIEIELDKKSYLAGESLKAHFTTPFSGKILVTRETDHVVSYQYVDVSKRDASGDLILTRDTVHEDYSQSHLI